MRWCKTQHTQMAVAKVYYTSWLWLPIGSREHVLVQDTAHTASSGYLLAAGDMHWCKTQHTQLAVATYWQQGTCIGARHSTHSWRWLPIGSRGHALVQDTAHTASGGYLLAAGDMHWCKTQHTQLAVATYWQHGACRTEAVNLYVC